MATMAATKDFTRSPLVDSSERKEQRRYIIQNAPITDEEIQEECNMVRYGNKNGKPGRNWNEDLKRVEEIKKRICLK